MDSLFNLRRLYENYTVKKKWKQDINKENYKKTEAD